MRGKTVCYLLSLCSDRIINTQFADHDKNRLKRYRREVVGGVIVLLLLIGGISVFKYTSFNSGFEIVDDLGGNIFPSAILSVALRTRR